MGPNPGHSEEVLWAFFFFFFFLYVYSPSLTYGDSSTIRLLVPGENNKERNHGKPNTEISAMFGRKKRYCKKTFSVSNE